MNDTVFASAPDPRLLAVFPAPDGVPSDMAVDLAPYAGRWLVDGELRRWTGAVQDVFSPIGTRVGDVVTPVRIGAAPMLGEAEALAALDAAVRAYGQGQGAWPTMSVPRRIEYLESFVPRMRAVREPVVRLLMWEIGKSRVDAESEFDRTVEYIVATIEAVKESDRAAARLTVTQGFIAQVRRSPLGVALCMGPFNYPLNETFTTLIPALVMGNTVVFKPPRFGLLLYLPLLEAFRDSFPPGVLNTVFGDGASVVGPLMRSGKIDVLAFIGSSRVADLLKKEHPRPHRLRCILGLDAKNPALIMEDADLDNAVKECLAGTLSFNGQRCTALKMLFVHRAVYDTFADKLAIAVSARVLGMPWTPGVHITPLPEPGKTQRLTALVDDARAHGATVLNASGGRSAATLFAPALVGPVGPRARLWHEEQFGPIVPVAPCEDDEAFVRYIVDSPFGQQVSLFGRDPERMGRIVDRLVHQVSRVNLNSQCQRGPDALPFTGRKSSAEGTLSVTDALRAFSIRAMVAGRATPANKALFTELATGRHSEFLSPDFIF